MKMRIQMSATKQKEHQNSSYRRLLLEASVELQTEAKLIVHRIAEPESAGALSFPLSIRPCF